MYNNVFGNFPKISEDSPKVFWRPDKRFRTLFENFQRSPNIVEDFWRRSKDFLIIHQHLCAVKGQEWYHVWIKITSSHCGILFLTICYHSVYHKILCNKYMSIWSLQFLAISLACYRLTKYLENCLDSVCNDWPDILECYCLISSRSQMSGVTQHFILHTGISQFNIWIDLTLNLSLTIRNVEIGCGEFLNCMQIFFP